MAMMYFLFSSEQLNFRKQAELKMGKTYMPGQVIVGGVKKSFTELLKDSKSSRYSDARIIAYLDTDKAKYTMPKSVYGGR